MITCTRRFEFDAAHRVLGHGAACKFLHGHRYVAEVTATTRELDALGMVTDFSVLKREVGSWIQDHFDHNILLNAGDPLLEVAQMADVAGPGRHAIFMGREPYIMDSRLGNPTAENLAALLGEVATCLLAPHSVTVTHVRLYETPACWADWSPVIQG